MRARVYSPRYSSRCWRRYNFSLCKSRRTVHARGYRNLRRWTLWDRACRHFRALSAAPLRRFCVFSQVLAEVCRRYSARGINGLRFNKRCLDVVGLKRFPGTWQLARDIIKYNEIGVAEKHRGIKLDSHISDVPFTLTENDDFNLSHCINARWTTVIKDNLKDI